MIEINIENNLDKVTQILPSEIKISSKIISSISEIIRADIEKNLSEGTGLDGAGLTPKKDGGRLFYQTGTLIKSVVKKTYVKQGEIFISSARSQIASYLNFGTKRIPKREFFGVSNRARKDIDILLTQTPLEVIIKDK